MSQAAESGSSCLFQMCTCLLLHPPPVQVPQHHPPAAEADARQAARPALLWSTGAPSRRHLGGLRCGAVLGEKWLRSVSHACRAAAPWAALRRASPRTLPLLGLWRDALPMPAPSHWLQALVAAQEAVAAAAAAAERAAAERVAAEQAVELELQAIESAFPDVAQELGVHGWVLPGWVLPGRLLRCRASGLAWNRGYHHLTCGPPHHRPAGRAPISAPGACGPSTRGWRHALGTAFRYQALHACASW